MRTHRGIDARNLAMAQAIAEIIDADPARTGLEKARQFCSKCIAKNPEVREFWDWQATLQLEWEQIRLVLLNPSEDANRLRQSSPFVGILSPKKRAEIFREYMERDAAGQFPYTVREGWEEMLRANPPESDPFIAFDTFEEWDTGIDQEAYAALTDEMDDDPMLPEEIVVIKEITLACKEGRMAVHSWEDVKAELFPEDPTSDVPAAHGPQKNT